MMWYWGYPYMGGGWGWILPILFWVFIFVIFSAVIRGSRYHRYYYGPNDRNEQRRDPLQILKERYAKGEINDDQYTKMRKELEK